jgi:hydrogenase nickel incorporation protein HypA/HybF
MHELSVTQALLDLAVRHGRAAGAKRVTALHVVVGELSSVVDESVQFYWDLISAGTIAQGARLEFRRVPAAFHCDACGHDYAPGAEALACPACASLRVRLTAGGEFWLEALEVDRPADPAGQPARDVAL